MSAFRSRVASREVAIQLQSGDGLAMSGDEWLSAFSGERFDWSLLQGFRWVAHAGSFRGAASDTGISINTLRAKVGRVEGLSGRKLFYRSVSGISVTADGLALLRLSDAVAAVLKRERGAESTTVGQGD